MSLRAARRGVVIAGVAVAALAPFQQPAAPDTFAGRVAALSEPGGYFDTDNLISNERSFLHVAPVLEQARIADGVYIGVGPDQNFSYIARVRPAMALIVDIRRDNLLLHLLFKALFEISGTRVEYLSNLTGRAPPGPPSDWDGSAIETIVEYVDDAPVVPPAERRALTTRVLASVRKTGVALTSADEATVRRFHDRFIDAGLSLQFNSTGRPPQWGYPTYRDLLLEVDRQGVRRNFLASEADFRFLERLQAADLVLPIVGDLAGSRAMPAIARFLKARRLRLSALYASNVEFYLFRQGTFGRFAANVAGLPRAESAVLVRSAFGGGAYADPGYNSASLTQPVPAFLAGVSTGRIRRYSDLVAASK